VQSLQFAEGQQKHSFLLLPGSPARMDFHQEMPLDYESVKITQLYSIQTISIKVKGKSVNHSRTAPFKDTYNEYSFIVKKSAGHHKLTARGEDSNY
jgi:hypothetical protein